MPRKSQSHTQLSDAAIQSLAELADRLKRARLLRNWTQRDAAQKSGLSVSSIKRWRPARHTSRWPATLPCWMSSVRRAHWTPYWPWVTTRWEKRSVQATPASVHGRARLPRTNGSCNAREAVCSRRRRPR
ncbi:MAG: helix-turn-helix transcriptional regulator [Gammaproteobacteria bacterium]|nr:helix-turn-helix transcriptional regulator [Gammaproteobacteria bacterium]